MVINRLFLLCCFAISSVAYAGKKAHTVSPTKTSSTKINKRGKSSKAVLKNDALTDVVKWKFSLFDITQQAVEQYQDKVEQYQDKMAIPYIVNPDNQ